MKQHLQHPIFSIISEEADALSQPCFVIGGFVRDLLLKRNSPDIDIVTLGSGINLAQQVAKRIGPKTPVSVFKNFGTAMLKYQELEVEFVGARKESYQSDSRKPIVEDGTLEDDQKRRDFTINALAIGLNQDNFGELIDPFGGIEDLQNQIIRTPLEPGITFSDDPLRMMRAIRFSTQLNFKIEANTLKAISANKNRIKIVSKERIIEEVNKIIMSDKPSKGFKLLEKTGLLELIFPELFQMKGREEVNGIGHKDNFYHTLEVLDRIVPNTDNLWLRWSAILHDIAKPRTKKFIKGQGWTFHAHNFIGAKMIPGIFRRMKLPLNEKMKYIQKMVSLHMRPIVLSEEEVTDSAIRRLLFEAGDDIDDLMTLCEADITSKNEAKVKRYLKNFQLVREKLKDLEERDHIRNFQPPVSGEEIMEVFNLRPSREVGDIKNAIKEAILEGEIHNDHDEAYNYMLKIAAEMGLKPVK
ncbi:CCA tRNA nucleotidyltransferase [Sunxiuqinia elliptica]|uniref:Poly(A) polymerase n=1 Tax=Sunxiuqinia elliptica TaxID=655355 RepID=A0A4R6H5K2_9BACT|nr:HD domain-containing protein [Sunxiuqinia elliptica]TDO03167.1 poly(A) polymerase [Sunxiuqinia elliptica]TDO59364.1 poly(A) polymerase [Sunxiuqinia elliptica]